MVIEIKGTKLRGNEKEDWVQDSCISKKIWWLCPCGKRYNSDNAFRQLEKTFVGFSVMSTSCPHCKLKQGINTGVKFLGYELK